MKKTIPFAIAVVAAAGFGVHVDAVELQPGVSVVVAADAPKPVQLAAADLARDLGKVLGRPSEVVASAASDRPAIVVETVADGRWEAHRMRTRGKNVLLEGSDPRGTAYAIYAFSERFLGVPPLWFWASRKPRPKDRVVVPDDLDIRFDEPYVRFRAWFPNDQDLITPWMRRSGRDESVYLETMMRLKLNTIEGHLLQKSDDAEEPLAITRNVRLAGDRGMFFTGHHIYVFGSQLKAWEHYWRRVRGQEPPELSVNSIDALETFWRYHIQRGIESGIPMIWLVGFRGDRDIPFWHTFADSPETDEARAKVIGSMIDRQIVLLEEVTGEARPRMRMTMYNENSDLVAAGLLKPPAKPSLIWNFVAARRDHFPADDLRTVAIPPDQLLGYYMNLQFTSSGAHLAQAEGPWKMERNFRYVNALGRRPIEFSVVNAGNIREFVLGLSANAAMLWSFDRFDTDRWLVDFCRDYFGDEQAAVVARLYRDYFNAFWNPTRPDLDGFPRQYLFQDMRHARASEQLVRQMLKGYVPDPFRDLPTDQPGDYLRIDPAVENAETRVEAVLKAMPRTAERFRDVAQRADRLRSEIPPPGRVFFDDNLRRQSHFMMDNCLQLANVAKAYEAFGRGELEYAVKHLHTAADHVARMQATLDESAHGAFQGWYDGDTLFNLTRLRERIEQAVLAIGLLQSEVPPANRE